MTHNVSNYLEVCRKIVQINSNKKQTTTLFEKSCKATRIRTKRRKFVGNLVQIDQNQVVCHLSFFDDYSDKDW